jgi:decaprenylphospho-beta-D-ribofuranose 2-oxidase
MFNKVTGWGRSITALMELRQLESEYTFIKIANDRGLLPRGLGRSYGDSALNSGGCALEIVAPSVFTFDLDNDEVEVSANASIAQLETEGLKFGLFPYVVPGTGQVTIGGAIASDIHGKSHHKMGSFSNHLKKMTLMTQVGKTQIVFPEGSSRHAFWSTTGGMGLTGLVFSARIKLRKVETSFVQVSEKRVRDLPEMINSLKEMNENFEYTVAWIDLSGKYRGRGIVSGANHAKLIDLPNKKRKKALSSKVAKPVSLPRFLSLPFINRATIALFNKLWYYKPLGAKLQHIQTYMHPLDKVSNWNILYGRKGFVQYQFVVPMESAQVLIDIVNIFKESKYCSFLSVLKTLGPESKSHLGFPIEGWTLAVDFPTGYQNLKETLSRVDMMVADCGGRIYLTKDSRTTAEYVQIFYPRLEEWKSVKSQLDPTNTWQSDQGRRLNLC